MTLTDLEALPAGTVLWLITGHFTASRVRLVEVRGQGAVRRPTVEAVDAAPGQTTGEFAVSAKSLLPLSTATERSDNRPNAGTSKEHTMTQRRMTAKFVATINTPGYLPNSDTPPPMFDDATSAWAYLAEERERAESEAYGLGADDAADTAGDAHRLASRSDVGSIWLVTPGPDSDHDLGLVYGVTEVPVRAATELTILLDDEDREDAPFSPWTATVVREEEDNLVGIGATPLDALSDLLSRTDALRLAQEGGL